VQAARVLFLAGAAMMAAVAVLGALRPRSVFDNLTAEPAPTRALDDLKRLAGHWPIYPALTIWFLFSFAPGSGTPLQYHLQNTLHASDAQWGQWNAIFATAFIPTYLLFGALCRRFPLRTLLWWGTVFAVPQMVPLMFIPSVNGALVGAAAVGLMGGVATAAYIDLIIRSAPPGLQGTTWMMAISLYWIAIRFGDVLGTHLYERFGGFGVCVIAITAVYALILPVLLLVPKRLIATADGEVAPKPAGA
ncbi:MAG TPA: MFS transporter, partial [Phenylobacterium sp.]|nr:MFS transporter [Phenylobacterium sp.]